MFYAIISVFASKLIGFPCIDLINMFVSHIMENRNTCRMLNIDLCYKKRRIIWDETQRDDISWRLV